CTPRRHRILHELLDRLRSGAVLRGTRPGSGPRVEGGHGAGDVVHHHRVHPGGRVAGRVDGFRTPGHDLQTRPVCDFHRVFQGTTTGVGAVSVHPQGTGIDGHDRATRTESTGDRGVGGVAHIRHPRGRGLGNLLVNGP